jgi:alkylhydroperoxidase family enzyme
MNNSQQSHTPEVTAGSPLPSLAGHPDAHRPEFDGHPPLRLFEELEKLPEAVRDALLALGASLMDAVAHRTRELGVLRVGAVLPNDYIWNGHVAISQRLAALDRKEIARVAFGHRAFDDHDEAVLWAVDCLLANRPIDVGTRATLGERDVLAVKVVTGFYITIAGIMRGIEPEPGTPQTAGITTPGEALGTYWEGNS